MANDPRLWVSNRTSNFHYAENLRGALVECEDRRQRQDLLIFLIGFELVWEGSTGE